MPFELEFGAGGGGGGGGGGDLEGAVMWARLASSTDPGDDVLELDRDGGLLAILGASQLFIDVGTYEHDFKAITNADVSGSTVTLPTPMTYGHEADALVAIMPLGDYVPITWMGVGGSTGTDATNNVAAFNRFCQKDGLAHVAGGCGVLFDGGILQNDTLVVLGDYVHVKGMGIIPGSGLVAHSSMAHPADGSQPMMSFQDLAGNIPTLDDTTSDGCWVQMENMVVLGYQSGGVNLSDGLGVVAVANGGYIKGTKSRYFDDTAFLIGGSGIHLDNMQSVETSRYGITLFGDAWTLIDPSSTTDNTAGDEDKAAIRVIGGRGGAVIGGDLEQQSIPGKIVSIEGDATGVRLDDLWTSGLQGGDGSGTIIDVTSTGPDAEGCYYEIVMFKCNQVNADTKILRDVERDFSITCALGHVDPTGIYARTLHARTVSATEVLYGPNLIAEAGTPQAAGGL